MQVETTAEHVVSSVTCTAVPLQEAETRAATLTVLVIEAMAEVLRVVEAYVVAAEVAISLGLVLGLAVLERAFSTMASSHSASYTPCTSRVHCMRWLPPWCSAVCAAPKGRDTPASHIACHGRGASGVDCPS